MVRSAVRIFVVSTLLFTPFVINEPVAEAANNCTTAAANPCNLDCEPGVTAKIETKTAGTGFNATVSCPRAGGGNWTMTCTGTLKCKNTTPADVVLGINNGTCTRNNAAPDVECKMDIIRTTPVPVLSTFGTLGAGTVLIGAAVWLLSWRRGLRAT